MYITLLFLTLFKHANSQFVEINFIISKYTCSDFSEEKKQYNKTSSSRVPTENFKARKFQKTFRGSLIS